MTTLTQLGYRINLQIGSLPTASVHELIKEGIRDYSTYFKRHVSYLIWEDLVAGQQTFELPDDFLAMLMVEFPINQDPPRYLKRRSLTHPNFWQEPGYYDYQYQPDARKADPANILYISDADLTPSQFLRIAYTAPHVSALGADTVLSIPVEHEHIIELFVIWKVYGQTLATYMSSPVSETDVTIMQQMKLAAESAERSYRTAIRAAVEHSSPGGWAGPWAFDDQDRIY